MSLLQLSHELSLAEAVGQRNAVRLLRQVEDAGPEGPPVLIPFGRAAVGKAPRVRRVVECALVDYRPIQKVAARIVRIFIGVENVDDGIFADREHQPVGSLGAAELIEVGIELLRFAAQIYGLAEEPSLDQKVRSRLADFVRFAARIAGDAKGVA